VIGRNARGSLRNTKAKSSAMAAKHGLVYGAGVLGETSLRARTRGQRTRCCLTKPSVLLDLVVGGNHPGAIVSARVELSISTENRLHAARAIGCVQNPPRTIIPILRKSITGIWNA